MKFFIKNLLIFAIPVPILILIYCGRIKFKQLDVDKKIDQINKYQNLLVGDSQIQRINPKYFKDPTYNFASYGEAYYFTYNKLFKLLNNKKSNIKSIVFGLSDHNFAPIFNKLFDVHQPEGLNSLKRYYYYLNKQSKPDFIQNMDYFSTQIIKNIALGEVDWGGYYYSSTRKKPDTAMINATIKMHYQRSSFNDEKISENQIKYLDKIVKLCTIHKIKLYFLSTPYHPYYKKKVDKIYSDMLMMTLKKYKWIKYIDFKSSDVNVDLMADGNHLNDQGSTFYSKKLSDFIASE